MNGWTRKSQLTITSSLVATSVTGMEVVLNQSNVPSELFSGIQGCKADGSDIRFSTDSAGLNLLEREVVFIDKTQSEIYLVVKLDVDSASNTSFYIWWLNPSASEPALQDLWSRYYGVVHFQEPPGQGDGWKNAKDSAGTYTGISDGGAGTRNGPFNPASSWSLSSNGNAEFTEMLKFEGDFFLEFWAYHASQPSAASQNMFAPKDYYSGTSTGIGVGAGGAGIFDDTSISASPGGISWGTWNQFAFVRNGNTVQYYVNGTPRGTISNSNILSDIRWLSGNSGTHLVVYGATYSIHGFKISRKSAPADAAEVISLRYSNFTNMNSFVSAGPVETQSEQVSLTLTGVVADTEIRIYRNSDNSELAGTENSDGSDFIYTYEYSGDIEVSIVIYNLAYKYVRFNSVTLGNTNTSIPIQQTLDRNYVNP